VGTLTLEPYAARLRWRFAEEQPLVRWQALFSAFFDKVGQATDAAGPYVIGHIKGLALLPGGGFVRGSKVSAGYPSDVEVHGADAAACAELEMSLNVLVYGLPLTRARRIVAEVGQELARQWDVALEVVAAGQDPVQGQPTSFHE